MSMKHETALKLKEAGFPFVECELENCTYVGSSLDEGGKNYHYPTLEELIERCTTFGNRPYIKDFDLEFRWGTPSYFVAKIYHTGAVFAIGRGDTPSEAVANLYLAIHKV